MMLGEVALVVPGQDPFRGAAAATTLPGRSRPTRSASLLGGREPAVGEAALDAALGNRRGSRCRAFERDRRAEREAEEEDAAEVQVVDQAEDVVDEVVVGDPPEPGAVVGLSPG